MPRSPESLERRREYVRRWRLEHPDYHRQWRAAHRLEEFERIRRWRALNPEKWRAQKQRYREKHPQERAEDDPFPRAFLGHSLFEEAEKICGPMPYFPADIWQWEEAMSCAVLAMCEGRDPAEAAHCARVTERTWQIRHGPIYPNLDFDHDGRPVLVARHED